jgi:rRNA maturation RNase YbeY
MIEIFNLTQNPIDEDFLRKVIGLVLKGEKKEEDLSLTLVGPGRIREINKLFFGKNRVIDVLAFPHSEILIERFKVGPKKGVKNLGQIIICLREIKKSSKRLNQPFQQELARTLILGVLKLLGYFNEKLKAKEKIYFSQLYGP